MYNQAQKNNKKLLIKILAIPIIILIIVLFIFYRRMKSKEISDIKLLEENVFLLKGETHKINYEIIPKEAKDEPLLWFSDNENAITIDHGVVVANKIGTANIWVSSKNKPEIKKKLIIVVSTKKEVFKQRLLNNYNFTTTDQRIYTQGKDYTFNFVENTFSSNTSGILYKYFYKEQRIEASMEANNTSGHIYINLATGDYNCTSTDEKWCGANDSAKISQNVNNLINMFNGYLGRDFTIDDL